jgi:hypothetical protein
MATDALDARMARLEGAYEQITSPDHAAPDAPGFSRREEGAAPSLP